MPSILKHIPTGTIPFKPLPIRTNLTSGSLTQNYYLLLNSIPETHFNLFTYLLLKANGRNYLKIDTILIKKYIKSKAIIKKDINSNIKLWGNNSYNNVVKGLIFLINSHIIIQLKPNSKDYIINPIYSYAKVQSGLSPTAIKFSEDYRKLIDNNELNANTLRSLAVRYFVEVESRYEKLRTGIYRFQTKETRRKAYLLYKLKKEQSKKC